MMLQKTSPKVTFDHGVDHMSSYVDETLIARLMTSADRAYYRHCGGIRWPMHVVKKTWNILERIWTSMIHR